MKLLTKKSEATAPQRSTSNVQRPTSNGSVSIAEAIALNERTLKEGAKRAGVESAKELSRLPAKEQNAIAQGGGYRLIAVAEIGLSALFNRAGFDEEKGKELDESVKKHGVIEPLIVRRRSQESGARSQDATYEIIAGERRWASARRCKLKELPCIVREATDAKLLELRLAENLEREELSALDEARQYRQLLDQPGYTMAMLEQATGKKKTVIYDRLKLLKLPEAAMKAVASGKLPASHAQLIAGIEDPETEARLAEQMLSPQTSYVEGKGGITREVVSFREAKAMTEVMEKEAADEAKWQEQASVYKAKGYKVASLAQCGNYFHYGSLKAGYVGAGEKRELDPQGRTWKALLGKHAPTAIVAKGGFPPQLRVLYAQKAAEKGLKAAGHEFAAADSKTRKEARHKREQEEREAEEARQFAIDCEKMSKVVAAVEAREASAETWRFIAEGLVEGHRNFEVIVKRRQLPVKKQAWDSERAAVRALVAKADGKTLRGLVCEILMWDWGRADTKELARVAKLYHVNFRASGKAGK